MLHAFDHPTPHRIFTVQPRSIIETDEKLAVGAVGMTAPCHRAGAADMHLARKLRLQIGLLGTTRAGAGRIARLCHEARNDPVEDNTVIEAFLGKLLDAGDMVRREIGPELDLHPSGLELHINGVVHGSPPRPRPFHMFWLPAKARASPRSISPCCPWQSAFSARLRPQAW